GGDRARPFVPEHRARTRDLLEHEVEVGAAHAAVRDLDEDVAWRELGHRDLLHLEPTVADVHRGEHLPRRPVRHRRILAPIAPLRSRRMAPESRRVVVWATG